MSGHDEERVEKAAKALHPVWELAPEYIRETARRTARAVLDAVGDDRREEFERQRALGAAAEHHRVAGRLTTVSAELFLREKEAREAAERALTAVDALTERDWVDWFVRSSLDPRGGKEAAATIIARQRAILATGGNQ